MQNHHRLSWLAALFALFFGGGRCHATEPQADFVLKNGWVEFTLRQDGRPVAHATIQILNEQGKVYAEVEDIDEGRTSFPLPPGASFVVEIKAGDRTADPIRIFKNGSSVEPARVLLSYGLRPCCRSIKPQGDAIIVGDPTDAPSAAAEEAIPWHFLVPVFAGLSISAAVIFMMWRR
jgi:hypothetical protein